MSRPVLIVDCYVDGSAAANIRRSLPRATSVVRANRDRLPASLAGYAGVIVTGSAASAMTGPGSDAPVWVQPLVAWLADVLRADTAVLGICFGHQVVAAAACGADVVRACAPPEVGWLDIALDQDVDDPLLAGLPARFRTFVSHAEEVVAAGDMRVLASSPGCAVHAYRLGLSRVWGVQFHCEMLADEEVAIVRGRAVKHPELALDVEGAQAEQVDSRALASQLFANFARQL